MTDGGRLRLLAPLEETGTPVVLVFSRHAIARYCSRVRPGLDRKQACLQLQGMCASTVLTSTRPVWATQTASLWLPLGEDVAFVVVPSRNHADELEATTCLLRTGAKVGSSCKQSRHSTRRAHPGKRQVVTT